MGRSGLPSEHMKYKRLMRPQRAVGPRVQGSGKLPGLGWHFGSNQHNEGMKYSKIPEVATLAAEKRPQDREPGSSSVEGGVAVVRQAGGESGEDDFQKHLGERQHLPCRALSQGVGEARGGPEPHTEGPGVGRIA